MYNKKKWSSIAHRYTTAIKYSAMQNIRKDIFVQLLPVFPLRKWPSSFEQLILAIQFPW